MYLLALQHSKLPHRRLRCRRKQTPIVAYRAPGATNAAFASETVIDEICEQIGMDPLEFRLKNASKEGTRRADGPVFLRIGQEEVVKAAMAHPHYNSPLEGTESRDAASPLDSGSTAAAHQQ